MPNEEIGVPSGPEDIAAAESYVAEKSEAGQRKLKEALLAELKESHAKIADHIASLEAELAPEPEPQCVALAMGATCPKCGYVRHELNLEPHPVA